MRHLPPLNAAQAARQDVAFAVAWLDHAVEQLDPAAGYGVPLAHVKGALAACAAALDVLPPDPLAESDARRRDAGGSPA